MGHKFCLEWKVIRTDTLVVPKVEDNIPRFEAEFGDHIGHKVEWRPDGKGRGGNVAILFLWYKDSPTDQTKQQWAIENYPRLRDHIYKYFGR